MVHPGCPVDLALKKSPYYNDLNQIRETRFSKSSFTDMIDSGFIEYKGGVVSFAGERHFLCEASVMYLLEESLGSLEGGDQIVFDAAFRYGEGVARKSKMQKAEPFISDYMSSVGWGDVVVLNKDGKYRAVSESFPWMQLADKVSFAMFRGIVSGILSGHLGRRVVLDKTSRNSSQGFFSLEAYE